METRDEDKTFWQRLCDAYAAKHKVKLTQAKAGSLISGTQGAAKKWKAGGQPSMSNAIELAQKLDVTVEWLLTGRPPRKPLSALEASLVEWFRLLDDDFQRSEALGMLKANVAMSHPAHPSARAIRSANRASTGY